jgi:drug/metabolite transporter (DMT)-like permease
VHFRLIHFYGPGFASLANYISPVWAVLLGVFLNEENVNLRQLIAFALILLDLAISDQFKGAKGNGSFH